MSLVAIEGSRVRISATQDGPEDATTRDRLHADFPVAPGSRVPRGIAARHA
jgi:hypothetical protein